MTKIFNRFLAASSVFLSTLSLPAHAQGLHPTFNGSVTPSATAAGMTTDWTLTITNNTGATRTDLAFGATMPATGFEEAFIGADGGSTTCSGVLDAPGGGTSLTFSGGQLLDGDSCTIIIPVRPTIAGIYSIGTTPLTSDLGTHFATSGNFDALITVPTVSFTSNPASIDPGSVARVSYVIDNTNTGGGSRAFVLSGELPVGLDFATPANVAHDCAVAGPTIDRNLKTFNSSFGSVNEGTFCSVSFDVTSDEAGQYLIDAIVDTGQTGFATNISGPVDGVVKVTGPAPNEVDLVKSFDVSQANAGDTVELEFTITNANRSAAANGLTFTDSLDDMISGAVATGLPLADPCGSGSQLTGTSNLTFSGGHLGPEAECTFTVDVLLPATATTNSYLNVTSPISGVLDGTPFTGAVAATTIRVLGDDAKPPILSVDFISDGTVPSTHPTLPGDQVTIRYTLENPNSTETASSIFFRHDFISPAIVSGVFGTNTCGSAPSFVVPPPGTTASPGTSIGNVTLAAGATCTLDFHAVVPDTAAPQTYPQQTSAVTAVVNGMPVEGPAATGDLEVTGGAILTLTKTFVEPVVAGGTPTTVSFHIKSDAESASTAENISFADDLAVFLPGAAFSSEVGNTCGGALSGTTNLMYSGGTLAPGQECLIEVAISIPTGVTGTFNNTAGPVTATAGGVATRAAASSADLQVIDGGPLITTMEVQANPVLPGDIVTIHYTLDNSAGTADYASIFFIQNFNDNITNASIVNVPSSGTCGPFGTVSGIGTGFMIASGMEVTAGTSCTFGIDLQIDAGTTPDLYKLVTSEVTVSHSIAAGLVLPAMEDDLEVQNAQILFTKSFSDENVPLDTPYQVTYTITNPLAQTIDTIAFTDNLQAILPGNQFLGLNSGDCTATVVPLAGLTGVDFSAGTLGPNESCSFTASMRSPMTGTPGLYSSSSSIITAEVAATGFAIDGPPAVDDFTLLDIVLPSFSKSASPALVGAGSSVTFEYTITNNDGTATLSGLQFSDDFDGVLSGMTLSAGPGSDPCGSGSSVGGVGTGTLTFTDGALAPGGSCTFSVTAQVPAMTTPGLRTSTTGDLFRSGIKLIDGADASFTVETPPTMTKTFLPASVVQGDVSRMTIGITNTAGVAATSLSFTDNFPAGMAVAANPDVVTTCTGAAHMIAANDTSISFNNGKVGAGSSCTFSVNVRATPLGPQSNTTEPLTSSLGTTAAATGVLTTTAAPPPTFAKSFASSSVPLNGTTTMTLTIDNSGALVDATALAVTDTFPPNMQVASTPNASSTCTGGTLTATAGAASASYSGGTVPAGQSCTITLDVTAVSTGTFQNITGNLTSSQGNSGFAQATLLVPSLAIDPQVTIDNIIAGSEAGSLTITGTSQHIEDGRPVAVVLSDSGSGSVPLTGTVSGNTWTATGDVTALADGVITVAATASDLNGSQAVAANHTASKDATPPSGQTIAFDQSAITLANQNAASVTFENAEVGAFFTVHISSDGGPGTAGTMGIVTSATQQITGLDLSTLPDGTLTVSLTLSDALGNAAPAVTDTVTKDTVAPTIAFDDPLAGDDVVNGSEASAVVVSGTTSGAEDGQQVTVSVADGASGTVPGTANVSGNAWTMTLDLSGLADGPLTLTADVTDLVGNPATQATDSLSKDEVVPTGYAAAFVPGAVNSTNVASTSFAFTGAEIGASFTYEITSAAGGTPVTGMGGPIASATETVAVPDLSGLGDGVLTLSVTITDTAGNPGGIVTDTITKDVGVPTLAIDDPLMRDNLFNAAEQTAVTISGTTTGVEDGQPVTVVIDSGTPPTLSASPVVSGGMWTFTFDLSTFPDGPLTILAQTSDVAGNSSALVTGSITKDTVAPTGYAVVIDQDPINLSNQTAVSFTYSGGEAGADFALAFTSSGGGAPVTDTGILPAASGTATGYDLSGLSDGTVTLTATLTDEAGNMGAPVTDTATKDTAQPTVTLAVPTDAQSDPFTVTATFSEDVTGFDLADLDIVGGVASGLSGSGDSYSFTVTPDHDGTIEITVTAASSQDLQGNDNLASGTETVEAHLTGTPDPTPLPDGDGDGSPDAHESASADRDGDGIPDAADYDPQGYFYCEDDGRILSGGGISVSGPSGSNSSVGIANDINILRDGSTGEFQWLALRPGTYTVTYSYPMSQGVPSTARLSSGTLDVTTLLPANPAVLGSTEFGATGSLASAALADNPVFYDTFVIEPGDPNVFGNNVPMTQCAENAVSVTATTNGSEANGGTTTDMSFTISQDRISAVDTVVSYTMGGTASSGVDYTTPSGTATIPAGQTSVTVSVPVLEDGLIEGTETAVLTLTAVTGGDAVTILSTTVSALSGTAEIADDDFALIAVTNIDLTASESGNDDASFGFVLQGQPTSDVTLTFAGDKQCRVSPSTLTFTSTNYTTQQVLTVRAVNDDKVEGTHNCQPTVVVSSGDGNYDGFGIALAQVVITDDLVDQIRDPLTEILKNDLEQTVRTQQRSFSRIAKGALGRLHAGQGDLACGTISRPDVDGRLLIQDGTGTSSGKFGWDVYNCQTMRREILDGSFSLNWSDDTGTQAMLQFSRQSEKFVSEGDLRGWFWGGYYSRNLVDDGNADGVINGYGINGGVYGAKDLGTGLFLDYYATAALGIHKYDLTFSSAPADIDAEGDYRYAALFGGIALSGSKEYEKVKVTPRIGLDLAHAWVSDADVTATQLGQTDTGTIELPDFSGGRFYAEVEFAGLSTQQGAAALGQMLTETSFTPRVACEYSSYGNKTECSAGINIAVMMTQPSKNLSYGFEIDYERMSDINRLTLDLTRERKFARGQGAVVTRLSMPSPENVSVEHGVQLDF